MVKRRNPVARSTVMRKGGAHRTSRSGERSTKRRATRDEADQALDDRAANERTSDASDNPDDPDSERRQDQSTP